MRTKDLLHGHGGVTVKGGGGPGVSKRCATIPASTQLPKIHSAPRPSICIINAPIVTHAPPAPAAAAASLSNLCERRDALSRNESNRYASAVSSARITARQAYR